MKKVKKVLGLTKEEAIVRRNELLQILNEYNEDLYAEREPKYNDDEIEQYSTELEILKDFVGMSDEEKQAIIDDEKITVNDDGTVTVKKTIFDKINPFVILLGIMTIVFAAGIISLSIGRNFIKGYIKGVYVHAEKKGFDDIYNFSNSKYCYNAFVFWLMATLGVSIIPAVMILVSVGVYLFTKKKEYMLDRKDRINTKIAFWVMIVTIVVGIISTVLITVLALRPDLMIYMEIPDECFMFWKETDIIPMVNLE